MKKIKISILQTMRHLVQFLFFLLLPGLYVSTFSGLKEIYMSILNHSFSLSLLPQLVEAASIIPVTILLGRFFCGWMCAFGTFGDFIYYISSKLFKRKFIISEKTDLVLKNLKYVLLVFLILAVWTFKADFTSYNPWDVFGMLATVGTTPDFSYIASTLKAGLVLFIAISIGSALVERFFCRYLCPMGAIFALTSNFRIAKITKPSSNCGSCRICTSNCVMRIPLYQQDEVCTGECIQCMKCVTACPRKNVSLTVSETDVRPIIAGAAAVTVITGFYYGGNLAVNAAGLSSATNTTISSNQKVYSSSNLYLDGTYEGTGTGFRGAQTTVSVTVKNGKITDVSTVSTGDDRPYYNRAFSTIADEIVSSQSTDVDSVSGATFSSRGIMSAVENALSTAKIASGSSMSSAVASSEASASASSTTTSTSDTSANGTAASKNATTDSSSSTNSTYKDGTYEGTGTGFRRSTTTVSVTIKNGKITDIATVSTGDDRPFYKRAYNTVTDEIITSQSTDVDSVSGATFSSRGIMSAVEDALSKAAR